MIIWVLFVLAYCIVYKHVTSFTFYNFIQSMFYRADMFY